MRYGLLCCAPVLAGALFTMLGAPRRPLPRRPGWSSPAISNLRSGIGNGGLDKPEPTLDTVAEDPALKFEPHRGKALRVRVPQGGNLGCNLMYRFLKRTGAEPEEIWLRYYVRLADDWDPAGQGGKFPGISGTYNRAGWGGRRVNGSDGWSARGSFSPQRNGETPIGFYCYHVDMRGRYGSIWVWDPGSPGLSAQQPAGTPWNSTSV